jgi:nitroreductase/NAD-dependent dihydropyrimidine dehydrogenase PreA subunit
MRSKPSRETGNKGLKTMPELKMETIDRIKAGKVKATLEACKPLLRPEGITNGVMKADPEKCTGCGLCIQNCPFKCWEMGSDNIPRMKSKYICFSCFNCLIACPVEAISIVQTFSVKDAFFDTDFPPIKLPLEPKDAEGKPDQWNEVERLIFNRRSVRNFKPDPVPEPLIRRVLEAGRFSPSAGNHQPWKLVVVTDPNFIKELEAECHQVWEELYGKYVDDKQAASLVKDTPIAVFDPRVSYGLGCVARKELPVFFKAPAVIFVGGNDKMADPEIHIGIATQNMCLTARSLGLGTCMSGFGRGVNFVPEIRAKLGFEAPWIVHTTLCLGYPRFKQEGIVPRHHRPVTWFRPGHKKPQIEK